MAAIRTRIRLSGTNLKRVADHNQRIVLHAIRVHGPLTRIELAQITGLTPPAVANITRRLLAEGFIHEAGRRRGGRGQPPADLVVNPDACYAFGVNVDRDHVTVVLVNFVGETIARRAREIPFALPMEVRGFYRSSVAEMLAETKIDPGEVVGVGVAKPDDLGTVDLPGRPASYSQWESADWDALFGSGLGLQVFVENDSAAAAMGEQQLGLGQRYPSFFYILMSWGLGGGLVIDGNYFRGAQGRSGEIGFLSAFNEAGDEIPIQKLVSRSGLCVYLEERGYALSDSASHPAAAAVHSWLDQATEALAEPIAAINCLINPAAILVGGRLPAKIVDQLAVRLNRKLGERSRDLPAVAPVIRASLAEDAPAVGAAILPFAHFLLPTNASLWHRTEASRTEAA